MSQLALELTLDIPAILQSYLVRIGVWNPQKRNLRRSLGVQNTSSIGVWMYRVKTSNQFAKA